MTNILLARLVAGSAGFIQDWQAGFRARRGCRDNTMALRSLCSEMLKLGKSLALTFIDYAAAFDSVSHKFIDLALKEAGVGNKERAIFKEIYKTASAFTAVKAEDGGSANSNTFPIRRGVVQGDVTSPLYFIMALELILRRHDTTPDKGVPLAETVIHTLGYADDLALVDDGDAEGIANSTTRVSSISKGSEEDADMTLSIPKTKVMHVRQQDAVSPMTDQEENNACKFICKHPGCDKALREAGASVKTRRMYRAIYEAASATTKVESVDGKTVMSRPFMIKRGVVQGDITSPLYFVIALELILRKYDTHPNKGGDLGGVRVHTLGYADDAALIDYDHVCHCGGLKNRGRHANESNSETRYRLPP